MIRDGTLPLRNPGTWICWPIVLYAASRLGFSSSYDTSTVILTRVGLTVSRALFTADLRACRRAVCADGHWALWRRVLRVRGTGPLARGVRRRRPRAHASRPAPGCLIAWLRW